MEGKFLGRSTDSTHGLASPSEVRGKSGREILQAIVDGWLPQAPIPRTLSFRVTEVGDGLPISLPLDR